MRRAEVGEVQPIEDLRHALHELSQPLTRLQWRLEIGQRLGDEATLRETVEGSLEDAREITEWLRRMRAQLAGKRMGGVITDGVVTDGPITDGVMGEQA